MLTQETAAKNDGEEDEWSNHIGIPEELIKNWTLLPTELELVRKNCRKSDKIGKNQLLLNHVSSILDLDSVPAVATPPQKRGAAGFRLSSLLRRWILD